LIFSVLWLTIVGSTLAKSAGTRMVVVGFMRLNFLMNNLGLLKTPSARLTAALFVNNVNGIADQSPEGAKGSG
jgi:hypothetical protein